MHANHPRGLLPFVLLTVGLGAQTWQLASPPTSPPPRATHAMATDLGSGRIVMFGGYAGSYLGDTWEYDGVTWTVVPGSGPAARGNHAMAADELRGRIVLFGGINGTGTNNWFGDTWEYAGGAWQQRASINHPPVRFGHAMAYDRTRGRVVMFGGRTRSGTIFLGDTWEWDGTNWLFSTPVPAPAARMDHAMAFDPVAGDVLLFGGIPLGGPVIGDTWTWNGTAWTQLAPAHAPSPRMQARMATDLLGGRTLLYAGYDGADLVDTWQWNGTDWSQLIAAVHPAVPVLPAMTTGPSGRHVVLFGGQDSAGVAQSETWWNGQFAAARAFGSGCGAPPLALAPAAGSAPVVGQTFTSEITAVPTGALPFQSLGLSDTSWLGVPLPIDLGQFGMPGCWFYHDAAALFLPCALAGSTATHALAIPNQPVFAGFTVFMQGFVLAPGVNAAGVLTSNALELTVGYP